MSNLDKIKRYGLDHAPRNWLDHYITADSSPLLDRLFVESFVIDKTLAIETWFDFEDLDALVVHTRNGQEFAVEIRK